MVDKWYFYVHVLFIIHHFNYCSSFFPQISAFYLRKIVITYRKKIVFWGNLRTLLKKCNYYYEYPLKIYDIDTWHDGRNVLYSWGQVKMLFRSFSYEKINLIRRRQLGTTGRILVTSLENWKVHREEPSDSQKCNRTHILGLLPFEPTQNFRIRPCIADLRRKCVRARTFFDVPFLEPSAPGSSTMTSPCLGDCI